MFTPHETRLETASPLRPDPEGGPMTRALPTLLWLLAAGFAIGVLIAVA